MDSAGFCVSLDVIMTKDFVDHVLPLFQFITINGQYISEDVPDLSVILRCDVECIAIAVPVSFCNP